MALTIANLEYQNDTVLLGKLIINQYTWFNSISVVEGFKGKARVTGAEFPDGLLRELDCDDVDTDSNIVGKDVDVIDYKMSIPVNQCDLHGTWLAHWARTYKDSENLYIETLLPYISEALGSEIKAKVFAQILAEAATDTDVEKVAVTPSGGTHASAVATLTSFVNGLSDEFLANSFSGGWWSSPLIHVSPRLYSDLTANVPNTSFFGGFFVEPNSVLTGDEIICTYDRNILVAFDDTMDVNQFKLVKKPFESKSYLIGTVAFGGSYLDSKKIVISS